MTKRSHLRSLEAELTRAPDEDTDNPPPSLDDLLSDHREALRFEYEDAQARGLLRCARGLMSFEVATVGRPGRFTVPELLDEHPRLVVVGPQGAGKSAIV